MLVSGLGDSDIGLVTPALDLSFWSWAFGPASFLITNHICFWTWMLGQAQLHSESEIRFVSGLGTWNVWLVTPALDLSFWSWAFGLASFLIRNYVCFWTWKLGRWTFHSSIGLVFWKLGLRPSFILKQKLCLFLDLEAGTLDLSPQHWTCLLEAGPSAQLHFK